MESITLQGITFRWNGDELLITTSTGQQSLSGSDAAQLLDFLQYRQQQLYAAEQGRELPQWARPSGRYVNGQISEVRPRIIDQGRREE
jgi:hypothetical protein